MGRAERPEHGGFALIVWRMEDDERSPRLEATAHLMAGAPDLLLAAMRYLNALDVWDGSNKADRHTERMEGELRAAVAKARESSNDPPPAHHAPRRTGRDLDIAGYAVGIAGGVLMLAALSGVVGPTLDARQQQHQAGAERHAAR